MVYNDLNTHDDMVKTMTDLTANLVEIFSSIQGEGPYIGYKQLFMRFANCNLNCAYCDTDFKEPETIKIEQTPTKQDFELLPNPIDIDTLFYYLKKLDPVRGFHHSLSLTGGEPLLQSEFLKAFLTENFAKYKFKIYLETNGTLPDELLKVIKLIDIVSMDIKIPTITKMPEHFWQQHKTFIEMLEENKKSKIEYFVKVVINEDLTDEDLYNVIWCMSSSESKAPVIIQPETNSTIDPIKLLNWQERLMKQLNEVRIIPQAHRMMNII